MQADLNLQVLLHEGGQQIVHPCYIRDVHAAQRPPPPTGDASPINVEEELRHRIAELEAELIVERERHQLLLAELQTAHHRQLLLQAHVRNLTDRIATLERQVKQYQDMIEEFSKRLLAGTLPTSAEQSGLAAELDLLRREREQLKQSLERTQSELQRANKRVAELELQVAQLQDEVRTQKMSNAVLQEEFRRFREQHSHMKLELGGTNRQLTDSLRDLLANHECTVYEGSHARVKQLNDETEAKKQLRWQLQNALQPLSTFQRMRNMTHHALFQFFLRRYREEKQQRKQVEVERDKALKDFQTLRESHSHDLGSVQGRLACEIDARARAEAQLREVERQVQQQTSATELLAALRTQLQEERVARRQAEARADRLEAQLAGKNESHKAALQAHEAAEAAVRAELEAARALLSTRNDELERVRTQLSASQAELEAFCEQQQPAKQVRFAEPARGSSLPPDHLLGLLSAEAREEYRSGVLLQWMAVMRESFEGDYMHAMSDASILHAMFDGGDEARDLDFCDTVRKVGRFATNMRLLVIVGEHLMLLEESGSHRLARRVRIADIEFFSVSRLHSEVVVIHHVKAHDIFLLVPKRAEFLFFLIRAYHRLTGGSKLAYKHAERIYVRDQEDTQREVEVFAPQQFRVSRSIILQ